MKPKRKQWKSRKQSPVSPDKKFSLKLLHEDDDIIVVIKGAGLLSVPIKGSAVPSALSILRGFTDSGKVLVVHRLDRFTSGILVFAKNERAKERLVTQFLAHTPKRMYLAVVKGHVRPSVGEMRHHLKLPTSGFKQFLAKKGDRGATPAILKYKVLAFLKSASVIEIDLVTGLKNQIRVQCALRNHPVVGERQYAQDTSGLIDHPALHAKFLGFNHPADGRWISFEAETPKKILDLISKLDAPVPKETVEEVPTEAPPQKPRSGKRRS